MNILYFYDSKKKKKLETDHKVFSYSLNSGSLRSKNQVILNDGERLNQIALELRQEYCDYIFSFNKTFLDFKLSFRDKLSLFFISDFGNKRTEFFDTFVTICHLLLVQEKMKEMSFDRIVTDGCSSDFIKALRSIYPNKIWNAKNTRVKRRYSWFRRYLIPLKFFGGGFLKRILLWVSGFRNSGHLNYFRGFLTFFPMTLKEEGRDVKYAGLVRREDCFIVSLLADGMHQSQSIFQYWKQVCTLKKIKEERPLVLLDKSLSLFDFVKGFFRNILLQWKRNRLRRQKFSFRGIDITSFIQSEFDLSFVRIPRILLYEKAIQKVFRDHQFKEFIYYLHEFCFGRFFSFVLNKQFPEVTTIGFQHGGPIPKTKILYALGKGEIGPGTDYLNHLPIPRSVWCEDALSYSIYEEGGYRNILKMPQIYRLQYLKEIPRGQEEINAILVACGLHDGPFLMENILPDIKANPTKRFIVKVHPNSEKELLTQKILNLKLPNIEIAEGHISKYLKIASEIICSDSSVSYEAFLLGKKVRIINLNNRICEFVPFSVLEENLKDERYISLAKK